MQKLEVKTVELTINGLLNDLSQGLTWFKAEDAGFGSIQAKYSANDLQVSQFRTHPKLKDAHPTLIQFRIIDDTTAEVAPAVPVIPEQPAFAIIDDTPEVAAPQQSLAGTMAQIHEPLPVIEANNAPAPAVPQEQVFDFMNNM